MGLENGLGDQEAVGLKYENKRYYEDIRDKSTELYAIAHGSYKEIRRTDRHKQLHRWP